MNKKKYLLITPLILFVPFFIIVFINYSHYLQGSKAVIVKGIQVQNIADFSDNRVLVGTSHNVFVGKVLKQIGSKELGIGPETQFEVEVIDNIKGNLKGIITLNQLGGYKNGILYIVASDSVESSSKNADSYLLKDGSTYVFSTRYNPNENWYTLISDPNAYKVISSDNKLDFSQLSAFSKNDPRVIELRNAYPNEILLKEDVASGNALNSHDSVIKE